MSCFCSCLIRYPLELEDWKAKGVPFATIGSMYERESKASVESIRRYEQATYYSGQWLPEFDRWVNRLASTFSGEEGRRLAWSHARTSDMVFGQPVFHELEKITTPTLLLIGETDITAIGKERATLDVAATRGHYPSLAKAAVGRIEGARLVTLSVKGVRLERPRWPLQLQT
jgi:pimeloyl-ACP methyl ester carboxylesterase